MKRIIRLTESDLTRIVRRVIRENEAAAGTGQIKIPAEAKFIGENRGEEAPWLRLTAMVGGNANKLAGNPNVVEFDARLAYSKDYQGDDKASKAGKVTAVKAYFGCKTGKYTTKNPEDGSILNLGGGQEAFKDWLLTTGLCPKGSYNSQAELAAAFRV
jgi:hypothetical protein